MPFPMKKDNQFSHYKTYKLKDGTIFKAMNYSDAYKYSIITGVSLATNE